MIAWEMAEAAFYTAPTEQSVYMLLSFNTLGYHPKLRYSRLQFPNKHDNQSAFRN